MKMTDSQLEIWFWDKFNSCYSAVSTGYTNSIFLYYDENYIRKMKLCKLNKQKITKRITVKGICLFKEMKTRNLLLWNYDKIWKEIENKTNDMSISYNYISTTIEKSLKDKYNINNYKSDYFIEMFNDEVFEYDKLTIL